MSRVAAREAHQAGMQRISLSPCFSLVACSTVQAWVLRLEEHTAKAMKKKHGMRSYLRDRTRSNQFKLKASLPTGAQSSDSTFPPTREYISRSVRWMDEIPARVYIF
ncbi:hypothetical protein RRG08_040574 [Elysia crispata]|uniref:Uncharacterized protein n=1 Tax=Elysia crispata TaxID=231223 RepID=A0AAE0Z852_9GAST|nr:hypothetical protein RRG08_040574 [Elysia crispata]